MFEIAIIGMLFCVVWALAMIRRALLEVRDAINNHKGGTVL